jgi:hypothetical protein
LGNWQREHGAVTKLLIQYRVFIASPSGLEEERKRFREKLEKFTALHAEPLGVIFHPVGWEETVGGVGRPQELINEDLKECDYAVFVLHDRWGSSPGSGAYTSGVEGRMGDYRAPVPRKQNTQRRVIFQRGCPAPETRSWGSTQSRPCV